MPNLLQNESEWQSKVAGRLGSVAATAEVMKSSYKPMLPHNDGAFSKRKFVKQQRLNTTIHGAAFQGKASSVH